MMKGLRVIAAIMAFLGFMATEARTRVACVGNSITYGFRVDDRERNCYPSQLQRMLGDDYEVGNFGHSGATLLNKGHNPYMKLPEFKEALAYDPDIVVIHLGINDTDPRNWPNFHDEFIGDYIALVDSFRSVNPDVRVILANLSPINSTHHRFRSGTRDWRLQIRKEIESVAEITGAELIDFQTPLQDRRALLPDGLHPDVKGQTLLAETVRSAITGDFGGLSMSPLYQSGMVLQRDRPLDIVGKADAGEKVTLTIDGKTYDTVADNLGQWEITISPLSAGTVYDMKVTAGKKTLHFKDILAGEVWIASGQSNMAFTLNEDNLAKETIAASADPELRFFDMKPVAFTDNKEWSDSVCALVNDLNYYRPASWRSVDPENAGPLSAVAYYFARQLRDSLDVPVGVISDAIGGSTTESWVSVEKLEEVMPEILVNWQGNDYVMPWAQGRAKKNSGAGRHPYEPSYLFAAATRQLGYFPVRGVIWYQGESNGHNIELHESLFKALVENWREYYRDSSLPVCFVQLSGINRPSWPLFRDSQRRLAEEIPNVAMAVSHDYGNPTDVHPRMKKPVGGRLALGALEMVYGADVVGGGPLPLGATTVGDNVIVRMKNGEGMAPANGNEIIGFEVAETEGYFQPAKAVVNGDGTLTVRSEKVKSPRFVRYAWQPFTNANLVNSSGLPASTFSIKSDVAKGTVPVAESK